jgi:hypothetical protein
VSPKALTKKVSIDWVYRGGDFQNYFRSYQQTELPGWTPIERQKVGQRGPFLSGLSKNNHLIHSSYDCIHTDCLLVVQRNLLRTGLEG